MYVASIVVVVVGVALLLYRWRKSAVERAYQRFDLARRFIGMMTFIAISWTFLRSGRPLLILVAAVLIFLVVLYVLVERPDETLS